jgi:Ricin-type beta-trefoil lectin domain
MARFMCASRSQAVRVPSTQFCASTTDAPRHTGRKHVGILVGVVSAVIGGVVAVQPAQAAIPFPFTIVNVGSGLCVEPAGSGFGEPILQQRCDSGKATQRWVDSRATTTHSQIANRGVSGCLDVRDGRNADWTVVQLWGCNVQTRTTRWQLFTLVPNRFFKFISAIGSRCLDVAGGSLEPGAQIQIYRCTPGNTNTAQIFELKEAPLREMTYLAPPAQNRMGP